MNARNFLEFIPKKKENERNYYLNPNKYITMEELEQIIENLIAEHGEEAVWGAVTNAGTGCPKGYIKNSQGVCVPDIG